MSAASRLSLTWLALMGASTVLVVGCGSDMRAEPVEFYQGRGKIITITYSENACITAERSVAITETDTEVIVDLRARRTGATCTLEGIYVTSEVLLRERLGDRAMVDASTAAEIPVAECRRASPCVPKPEP